MPPPPGAQAPGYAITPHEWGFSRSRIYPAPSRSPAIDRRAVGVLGTALVGSGLLALLGGGDRRDVYAPRTHG